MGTKDPPAPAAHRGVAHRFARFTLQVLRDFHRCQGLLLAGAVAYYTLLSIVPLFAIILVGLSHFVDENQLIQTIARNIELLIPGYADSLANQVRMFLARRHLVGVVGFLIMLFFSSMAFSVLESTMAVIFPHREKSMRRPFLISAIIPYFYILLMALGLLLVTLISGAMEALERQQLLLLGYELNLKGSSKTLLYLMGMSGMVLMLTSFYLVMPGTHFVAPRPERGDHGDRALGDDPAHPGRHRRSRQWRHPGAQRWRRARAGMVAISDRERSGGALSAARRFLWQNFARSDFGPARVRWLVSQTRRGELNACCAADIDPSGRPGRRRL